MVDSYVVVDSGPSFVPLRYGLLSVAEPASAPGWRHGIQRQQPICAAALSIEALPCAPSATGITGTASAPSSADDTFRVYAVIPCAPPGYGNDLNDLMIRTQALLTNGEARAVEKVMATGRTDNGTLIYPHLPANAPVNFSDQGAHHVIRQRAATTKTAAAVDVVEALGLIEMELASCYGGEGIVHVPRQAFPILDHAGVVHAQGQQLRTIAGNYVAGYSTAILSPSGGTPATGTGWFYGTGMAQVYKSDITDYGEQPADFVGREDNSTFYVVSRDYAISYDCCLVAAQVALGGMIQGTAGAAT
jgi:hypothetical protein